MTPQRIWTFARRWLWLVAVLTVVGGVTSYMVSSRLPRVYEGAAKLMVTPGQASGGASNYNDVLAAERLTRTYSEVLKTQPIVDRAASQAGLDIPFERAVELIDASPVRDTQLIQITARANDPETAANFANQLAAVFIEQTQLNQAGRFAASKGTLSKQVDQLRADIAAHTRDLDALRTQEASDTRDGEVARLRSELAQLQESYATGITDVQAYDNVRAGEARVSDLLSVVAPATPALKPVQPRVLLNVLLAALLGLLIGLGAAYLVDYLDDRLVTPERLSHFTGLHSLGSIAVLPGNVAATLNSMPVHEASSGSVAYGEGRAVDPSEAFRLLRANLQFAAVERPLRTLLVTSSEPGDGKSTIAADLAIVIAQSGQNVILVDADLRKPTQHTAFGVRNRVGLSSLIRDASMPVENALAITRVNRLFLVPSGPLPPNPGELLASQRTRGRLEELSKLADLIILDSPPVLAVSDPAVLAGMVDGTLLVVNSHRTRGQHAAEATQTLRSAGGHMLGVVLNRVRSRRAGYYGSYGQEVSKGVESAEPAPGGVPASLTSEVSSSNGRLVQAPQTDGSVSVNGQEAHLDVSEGGTARAS